MDVFLGDVSWETSYSLPGEEQPPRVRADVSVDWPTWSQTSYRSWSIGEPPDELPEIVVEVALRVQRLAQAPDTDMVLHALPEANPLLGVEPLVRTATTIEQVHAGGHVRWAVEATYEGSVRFSEAQLESPGRDRPRGLGPHPLDLLDAGPAGRPALRVPPARRGRGLRSRRRHPPRPPPAAGCAPPPVSRSTSGSVSCCPPASAGRCPPSPRRPPPIRPSR